VADRTDPNGVSPVGCAGSGITIRPPDGGRGTRDRDRIVSREARNQDNCAQ
jgi:hypothetical protein